MGIFDRLFVKKRRKVKNTEAPQASYVHSIEKTPSTKPSIIEVKSGERAGAIKEKITEGVKPLLSDKIGGVVIAGLKVHSIRNVLAVESSARQT